MEGDVVGDDPGGVEMSHHLEQGGGPLVRRDGQPPAPVVEPRLLSGNRRQQLAGGIAPFILDVELHHVPTYLGLQLVGGALGDEPALVDHPDAVGETVRLLQVLSGEQQGRPPRNQLADQVPQVDTAAGIDAGGGLVEEQHGGLAHHRGGQVETSPHPARVGAHLAVGGIGEVDPLQHLPGALAGLPPGHPR